MQRGRVYNLSKFQILDFLKTNIYLIISLSFLILGVTLGLVLFDDFKIFHNFCESFLKKYIELRSTSEFLKITCFSYIKSLLILMLIFVSGTSLFGVVTTPLIVSFCGIFYGSIITYLYSTFAIKGVAFNAVIFLPSNLVILVFIIISTKLAIKFSIEIVKLTLPNPMQGDLFLTFKDYSIKFLLVSLGGFLSAFVDGITAVGMLRFFEF